MGSSSFSMVSTTMIATSGVDKCHINFCKSVNSVNVIEMLEQLRAKYGKVFIILDNASVHKSKTIKEYLAETTGDVVLWYCHHTLHSTTQSRFCGVRSNVLWQAGILRVDLSRWSSPYIACSEGEDVLSICLITCLTQ